MSELAPIGIGTYNRFEHFQKVIEALQKNTLAEESDLFIFIDGPLEKDKNANNQIFSYSNKINGFKSTNIIRRKENLFLMNNYLGFEQLLNDYGKVIWMEDDIVTTPGFLTFMNEALEFYKDDDRIISICAYKHKFDTPDLTSDGFILDYFCGWGMASWKDKWSLENFNRTSNNFKKVAKEYKKDRLASYNIKLLDDKKLIDALDSRITFYEYFNKKFTLYPKKSLVINIGNDNSGIHSLRTKKFDVELWEKTSNFIFESKIQYKDEIQNNAKSHFSGDYKTKITSKIIELNLYPTVKKIFKKLMK